MKPANLKMKSSGMVLFVVILLPLQLWAQSRIYESKYERRLTLRLAWHFVYAFQSFLKNRQWHQELILLSGL